MTPPSTTPYATLLQWLTQAATSLATGTPLPTEEDLVKRFGVSRSSVQRAFRALEQQSATRGRIVRLRGKGSFLGPLPAPDSENIDLVSGNRLASHVHVQRALLARISSGELRTGGPFPPIKWTAGHYQVSLSTVSTAYRALVRQGMAHRTGRRYRVGPPQPLNRSGAKRFIRLVLWEIRKNSRYFSDRSLGRSLLRAEVELAGYGRPLIPMSNSDLPALCRRIAACHEEPVGILLYGVTRRNEVEEAVRHLDTAFKKADTKSSFAPPRVLIVGLSSATARLTRLPTGFQVFNTGNLDTIQMRTCAQRILEAGIQSVVLHFAPDDDEDRFARYIKLVPELLQARPEFAISLRLAPSPDSVQPGEVLEVFRNRLRRLGPVLSKYKQEGTVPDVEALLKIGMGDANPDSDKRQKGGSGPEAWIFTRTLSALKVMAEVTKPNSGRPTGSPWFLSLDEDPAAMRHGISCCLPDWDGIGYAMAHALLQDIPVERSRRGFLRAKALFLDRRASGAD